jgi:hypothetical protein
MTAKSVEVKADKAKSSRSRSTHAKAIFLETMEMKKLVCTAMGASLMLLSAIGHAAAPANAPAGATGLCKDGSYYSGPTKKGACKGHKGVKEWYAESAPATKPTSAASAPAAAATPPAGSTGLCKDGTYYSGPTKKGACKGHKGVKEWYGTSAAIAAPAAPATPARATAAPTAPAPATPAASPATSKASKAPEAAAPGGGVGKVWINKTTKVYHCPGDRWYGKTKEGEYVSEAQAVAQGAKPDHGKACK